MKFDIEAVKEFIQNTTPETKIYIGADSERHKRRGEWFAEYAVAVVVHFDGNKGCKVFGSLHTAKDFDQKQDRPFNRLMTEVYKASEMYLQLAEAIGERHCEIHLDLNGDEKHGSNCAVQSAVGYIKGTCNITPFIKPNSPAASFCADRLKELVA